MTILIQNLLTPRSIRGKQTVACILATIYKCYKYIQAVFMSPPKTQLTPTILQCGNKTVSSTHVTNINVQKKQQLVDNVNTAQTQTERKSYVISHSRSMRCSVLKIDTSMRMLGKVSHKVHPSTLIGKVTKVAGSTISKTYEIYNSVKSIPSSNNSQPTSIGKVTQVVRSALSKTYDR